MNNGITRIASCCMHSADLFGVLFLLTVQWTID